MTVAFVGHSFLQGKNQVKELVKNEIRRIISSTGSATFYFGGCGDFDYLCARACKELKGELDGIEVRYVSPYLSLTEQRKINEIQEMGLSDASIYPPIEEIPVRLAIIKRNEWMISRSDLVIAWVDHSFGGAYKTLSFAKAKKKRIINLALLK